MTLNAQIADDVTTVFLNSDDFAETVTYTPSGGVARSILAVVISQPSEIVREGNHDVEHKVIHVLADRDDTTGVTAPAKGDKLTWNGAVYSWVGFVSVDSAAYHLKFSCPTYLNAGHQRGFGN